MLSRPQIVAAVTVVALGGVTAFAISSGNNAAGEKKPAAKAATTKPIVNTITIQRTIPTKSERRQAQRERAARRRAVQKHRIAIAKLLGKPVPVDSKAKRRAAARRRKAIASHRKAIVTHRKELAKLLAEEKKAAAKK
jgi:hypothetical protein